MFIFLISRSFQRIEENGKKVGFVIEETNGFLNNLKKTIKKYDNFVFLANDPQSFCENDESLKFITTAFKKQLSPFKNAAILDNRTKNNAKQLLKNADVVFLQGGKVGIQNKFLYDIDFKNNINKDAVLIGKSAGAINLTKISYDYPETDEEIGIKNWYDGMGFCDITIIPHFNLKNKGNEFCFGSFNLLTDYYLPASKKTPLYCLEEGSYATVYEGKITIFGNCYLLDKENITKICETNKTFKIK